MFHLWEFDTPVLIEEMKNWGGITYGDPNVINELVSRDGCTKELKHDIIVREFDSFMMEYRAYEYADLPDILRLFMIALDKIKWFIYQRKIVKNVIEYCTERG